MSRIKPLDPNDLPHLRTAFQGAEKLMGFLPNDALVMAHRPAILGGFAQLVQSIYAPGEVADGLKRLIGIVVSNAAGCQYCKSHAAHAAFRNGEDKEKIKAIWDFQSSDLFEDQEKVVLNLAVKSAMVPNEVTDEDFKAVRRFFSDGQIVEIVSVIAMYGFLNRWNLTLATTLEDTPNNFVQQLKK